jgi:hypothetical protein
MRSTSESTGDIGHDELTTRVPSRDIFRVSKPKQSGIKKAIRNGMKAAGNGRITKAAFAVQPGQSIHPKRKNDGP